MRGVPDADRLRSRNTAVENDIYSFEYRDVDCSGRSLATLMVAWVGAAMVASVLLRWKYMWIALTVLTLLFLFACGYAACNARRAHERSLANEEARILERRRQVGDIQSVSGAIDDCSEITDPPAYQTYWITDLPPPYAVVIGAELQAPSSSPAIARNAHSEPESPTSSKPPPYSIAVQSSLRGHSQMTTNQSPETVAYPVETSSSDNQNVSLNEATNSQVIRDLPVSRVVGNDDRKILIEQSRSGGENSTSSSHAVVSSGTQYLSNLINCTFGRGQRRNNVERSSSLQTAIASSTNDRRDISQLSNRDNTASGISTSNL